MAVPHWRARVALSLAAHRAWHFSASGARCGREGFPPLSGAVGAIWEDAAAAAAAGREQLAGEKLEMICQSLVPAESWGPKLCRRPGLA
jgi:hypothetical protein